MLKTQSFLWTALATLVPIHSADHFSGCEKKNSFPARNSQSCFHSDQSYLQIIYTQIKNHLFVLQYTHTHTHTHINTLSIKSLVRRKHMLCLCKIQTKWNPWYPILKFPLITHTIFSDMKTKVCIINTHTQREREREMRERFLEV